VPVLRPHPELEGTRYELLPGQAAVGLLVIAANVEDISRSLQHDGDAV
jgi:hypothetical protein